MLAAAHEATPPSSAVLHDTMAGVPASTYLAKHGSSLLQQLCAARSIIRCQPQLLQRQQHPGMLHWCLCQRKNVVQQALHQPSQRLDVAAVLSRCPALQLLLRNSCCTAFRQLRCMLLQALNKQQVCCRRAATAAGRSRCYGRLLAGCTPASLGGLRCCCRCWLPHCCGQLSLQPHKRLHHRLPG